MRKVLLAATLAFAAAAQPPSQFATAERSGWKITPAGKLVPVDTLPMASAVSRDGKYLLVLNGGYHPPSISVIDLVSTSELSRTPVPDAWLGLAFSPKGDRVYVGGGSRACVFEFSFAEGKLMAGRTFPVAPEAKRTADDFIGDVAVSPDGTKLYAADLFRNSLVVLNAQTGALISRIKTGRRPYRIAFLPGEQSFVVSNWADGTLSHFQTADAASMGTIRVGPHPTDIVFRVGATTSAFVAAANTNKVFRFSVSGQGELAPLDTLPVTMTSRQPLGMTPSGLALSADGTRLYIACSDANTVAVADVSDNVGHVVGFIPTGRYPTAVRILPDSRLLVLNGHGEMPITGGGTAEFIDVPGEPKLFEYTRSALANSFYTDAKLDNPAPESLSRIKHVIYILQNDRATGAQTPNRLKLAREFTQIDNFLPDGEANEDRQSWATAGIAGDFLQKLLPNSRAGRRQHSGYDGSEPASVPPAGYLWNSARQAGISLRNYGMFANNRSNPGTDGVQIDSVSDSTLAPLTSPLFRGADPAYPDLQRVKAFETELSGYVSSGIMPQLEIMLLSGSDSDVALEHVVEAVSKSKFWPETTIFVSGPSALVVSPYTRSGTVDHSAFSTVSLLRTVELILRLRPMTQFDAAANSAQALFQPDPSFSPYSASK